ncbi:hypothetical protein SAMN05216184_101285 [Georgenia satyanarayanai]|uniref:Uncharacterized protein n=1 Tax=Georgenia satyanarayanai TaxID=860221 RepID=A0A2Y8ZWA7_9MICO|nr:hypothetical protein [Georgenia satyanarayanai]PYG01821.1 hypothetical protein A8987_101285 [Georgenia satyanarayanai]SSA36621.1 hypothetical protein SAMN05216184_101285 [Georgenia satyanarayanai]
MGRGPGRPTTASVVATDETTDLDGARSPAGEVHAWVPGTNQTVCGLALSRERLARFSHVPWAEVQPATGTHADAVTSLCSRCAAGMGARRGEKRWKRVDPRP